MGRLPQNQPHHPGHRCRSRSRCSPGRGHGGQHQPRPGQPDRRSVADQPGTAGAEPGRQRQAVRARRLLAGHGARGGACLRPVCPARDGRSVGAQPGGAPSRGTPPLPAAWRDRPQSQTGGPERRLPPPHALPAAHRPDSRGHRPDQHLPRPIRRCGQRAAGLGHPLRHRRRGHRLPAARLRRQRGAVDQEPAGRRARSGQQRRAHGQGGARHPALPAQRRLVALYGTGLRHLAVGTAVAGPCRRRLQCGPGARPAAVRLQGQRSAARQGRHRLVQRSAPRVGGHGAGRAQSAVRQSLRRLRGGGHLARTFAGVAGRIRQSQNHRPLGLPQGRNLPA